MAVDTQPSGTERLKPEERRVLGAWLKVTSQARGLRQHDLAARCGLERVAISHVYTGRVVKRHNYALLAGVLGYTVEEALELAHRSLDHVIVPLTTGPTQREDPRNDEETGMYDKASVITVCAQKGGVGKTTCVVTLATMLAEGGSRVLVLDLDSQANATAWLLGEYDEDDGQMLVRAFEKLEPLPIVSSTYGVDVVPSGRDMARLDSILTALTAGHVRVKKLLGPILGDYDYILIDTPPKLGIVTTSALTASDHALLPARTDGFSLDAVECTMDTCLEVQEDLNDRLEVLGCVVLEYDKRTVVSRELTRQLDMIEDLSVLKPCIASCVYFKQATAVRIPIHVYRPEHKATRQFRQLANLIDARCRPLKQVV